MIAIAGIASAAVLVLLSAIHIYWAFGGESATTATVPTVDGRPRITPSTAATLVVALLFALAAGLVGGSVFEFGPRPLFRLGSAGCQCRAVLPCDRRARLRRILQARPRHAVRQPRHVRLLAPVPAALRRNAGGRDRFVRRHRSERH